MKVSQFMTGNPVTLKESDTIKQAAELFTRHFIDGAPVVDGAGKISGIFTKNHLYRAIINSYAPETAVSCLMKRDVISIDVDMPAEKAWQIAQEKHIGRFPVVDRSGALVAMMTRTNLVRAFSKTTELYEELNAVINSSYDGIVVVDESGTVVQRNRAFEKMGLQVNESIINFARQAIEKSNAVTRLYQLEDGRELLLTANPVRGSSERKTTKVVINCRDISELNKLRREVAASRELSEIYHLELETLRAKYLGHTLVCESQVMRNILDLAIRVAKVDSTILILGESGVGKDVVTRLIHKAGRRSAEPFIRINCGAIPENLLESELFGYQPGAFTGARREGKPGLLELAHKGTLFLDEIAELPLALQVKLLNVIQDREVTRLGGVKPMPVDVRIIAATNKNLAAMVKKGRFRTDLYYRLHVVPITIPPLRERRSDIPALVIHFLRKFNEKYHLNKSISAETMEYLTRYHWPGNVRELENLIERLMVINTHDTIGPRDLPTVFLRSGGKSTLNAGENGCGSEKELIEELYRRLQSTRKVAEVLGVHQSTVVRKMKKYNIKVIKINEQRV
ncbi:sigma-54-dependent Fis family transcriptional regulator [Desulfoscipio geothermicus]|uniref:HTH-type transcriptional regulatory protein TyrR n=1 Tax=Desulfoscipio geothermicus DSM 3669 TaxID=1121426 RepID=A0A1I6DK50_9FIRM|nr:sigma-54-dependent Fis family transcriptional regulator [Desulfoscipio geothermicus]SFR05738.1 Transcriptional regulator containing PAS, AAA-type ATPase, and DNA-binding Fis domains [Desulfoscipio geothermicus DSM 3669]